MLYAFIPARGGSKGLPGKNIRTLAGKPLIAYSIEAALRCPCISRVIVSTDDREIAQVSRRFGAEVIDRPAELATDTSQTSEAIRYLLETLRREGSFPDAFVLLQPTSPFRGAHDVADCISAWASSACRSAVSVTPAEHHPYKTLIETDGALVPMKDYASLDALRQTLPRAWRLNGSLYVLDSGLFLARDSFVIPPILPFVMDEASSIDIDTELDFHLAELVLQRMDIAPEAAHGCVSAR